MSATNQHRALWAFADRFMDALERGDREEVLGFYAADARFWHNYDDVEQTVEDNLKILDWMIRKLPQRAYRIVRREALPDGWLQQHVLEGTLVDGRSMQMHACCVIRLRDGLISRIEEYLDPSQAAVLRSRK